jgi:hypothetical protein
MNKNNLVSVGLLLAFSFCLFIGCGGSVETARQETAKETLNDFFARYEKTFNPSQYEIEFNIAKAVAAQESTSSQTVTVSDTASPEMISGFRVQVLTTEEIDTATTLRDSLSTLLQDQWTYVVYDAPYYKVRVGNFIDRLSANALVDILVKQGFSNAWVVPDQVLKHPPPKPKVIPNQPEQQQREH